MNDIDDIINDAQKGGGTWVKLDSATVGDHITGEVLDLKPLPRTDPEGNVVLSRKTKEPRQIYRLTFRADESQRTDDDDTMVRYFDANESAQWAIRDALVKWRKENPTAELVGCKFALSVKKAAPGEYSQAEYSAKFGQPTAPAKPSVSVDDLIGDD